MSASAASADAAAVTTPSFTTVVSSRAPLTESSYEFWRSAAPIASPSSVRLGRTLHGSSTNTASGYAATGDGALAATCVGSSSVFARTYGAGAGARLVAAGCTTKHDPRPTGPAGAAIVNTAASSSTTAVTNSAGVVYEPATYGNVRNKNGNKNSSSIVIGLPLGATTSANAKGSSSSSAMNTSFIATSSTTTAGNSGISREAFEKARLATRVGGYAHWDPVNDAGSPFVPANNTTLYQGPEQQFSPAPALSSHTRAEAALRDSQCAATAHRLSLLDARRAAALERERGRWAALEAAEAAESARISAERERGVKAKRGAGSVPFDLVTHTYTDSAAARSMRAADADADARAHARTRALAAQQNKHGYNPITGAPV